MYMATLKKRINISVSKGTERILAVLARRDQVPQATKAAQLLHLALELEEDAVLDAIARTRDRRGVRRISHRGAWS